jgi:hypothetical protein
MLTKEFADNFCAEWIAAWNSHNLANILAHYSDDFEMSSPYIAQIGAEPSGVLKGKQAIAEYWSKALSRNPTLHFEHHATLIGTESLVIYYRGARGMAAEIFFFETTGKVYKAAAHYMPV